MILKNRTLALKKKTFIVDENLEFGNLDQTKKSFPLYIRDLGR